MTAMHTRPITDERPTDRQVRYALDLGGDANAIGVMSKAILSRYIDRLLAIKRGTLPPHETYAYVPPSEPVRPARLRCARTGLDHAAHWADECPDDRPCYAHPSCKGAHHFGDCPGPAESPIPLELFARLRNGFYAWQPDDTTPYRFIRVKEWKSGRMKGARVVSTQYGPNYKHAFAVFPSGQWRVYDLSAVDVILGAIADQRSCALNYAHLKHKCCRCNLDLTDEHSRWYGIGPVCDKVWTEILDEVDNELSFTFDERWSHRDEWPHWYTEVLA